MDKLNTVIDSAKDFVEKNKQAVAIGAGVTTTALVAAYAWKRAANYVPKSGPYSPNTLPADAYDGEAMGVEGRRSALVGP